MNVKTSSYAASIVSLVAAILLTSGILLASHRTDEAAIRESHIDSIVKAVNQRRTVVDRYLRYHRDEFAIEWQVLHQGTVALLQSQEFHSPEEQSILEDMREDNAETKRLFAVLVALHGPAASGANATIAPEVAEEQVVKRLWLLSDAIEDGASRLREISIQERRSILTAAKVLGLVSACALVGLVVFILLFVNVRVVRPLTALNALMSVIAHGNWERRIGDTRPDELGQLARSFDGMIDELQKAHLKQQSDELQLRASLREKEVLLKEIHHRVKNNLQVISSLLSLQANRVSDTAARTVLKESHGRVYSIALVHEQLYGSRDLGSVHFREYLEQLVTSLLDTFMGRSRRVAVDVSGERVDLGVDVAIPCGLIANELVTNSLKHAFPNGRAGRVHVSIARERDDQVLLQVEDDGVGLPSTRDLNECRSLGLQLVRRLVAQIHGTIEIDGNGGLRFSIRFPAPIAGQSDRAEAIDERPASPSAQPCESNVSGSVH